MALSRLSLLSASLVMALATSGCSSSVGDFFDDLFGDSSDQNSELSVTPANVAAKKPAKAIQKAKAGPFCVREGRYLELSIPKCVQVGGILVEEGPSSDEDAPKAAPSQMVQSEPLRNPHLQKASVSGDPMTWGAKVWPEKQQAIQRRTATAKTSFDGALANGRMGLAQPPLDYFAKAGDKPISRQAPQRPVAKPQMAALPATLPDSSAQTTAPLALSAPAAPLATGAKTKPVTRYKAKMNANPKQPAFDLGNGSSYNGGAQDTLLPLKTPAQTGSQTGATPNLEEQRRQKAQENLQQEILAMPTIRSLRSGQFSNLRGSENQPQGGMTALFPFANLRSQN